MELRRTYRLTSERAPRLLFELSRVGEREDPNTIVVAQERYRVGDAHVSIDHVEPLGWFCVITAERAEPIAELAERLGLTAVDLESRSYAVSRLRGRAQRIALIALAGLLVAFFDLGSGLLVATVLLLLEWGFGGSAEVARS